MMIDEPTMTALMDETPKPLAVPAIPLTAGDVQWLESAARHMGISIQEAVAWAVQQHKAQCLYPAEVKRSLELSSHSTTD